MPDSQKTAEKGAEWVPGKVPVKQPENSVDRKRGQRKGATSKNVKNRQKVSKIFSALFDIFRAGQKTSKSVKKCQKYFQHFSTIFARHRFSGPFWGALKNSRKNQPKKIKTAVLRMLFFSGCFPGPTSFSMSGICQRFRKGVGGRGLATNNAQNTAKTVSQNSVLLLIRGHRKKRQEKGLNLWCGRDFLVPTPSVCQPLFETSEFGT